MFQAGVLPPDPTVYGLGVRAVASHAGVFPCSAYGFGVREFADQAGVRLSL